MKVALLGYGNVGGGAYDIICEMKGGLAVKHILARSIRPGMEAVMTTDFKDILNDEEIDIVAETIGGLHPAYEYVTEALKAKKHVVSANKQLICHYYSELMALAGEIFHDRKRTAIWRGAFRGSAAGLCRSRAFRGYRRQ